MPWQRCQGIAPNYPDELEIWREGGPTQPPRANGTGLEINGLR